MGGFIVPISERGPEWVSKTDLTRYLRCPYAFYVLDRGLIPFEATVNVQEAELIQKVVAFHAGVEAAAALASIEPTDLPKLIAQEAKGQFRVPILENASLKIRGQPDRIDLAQGALLPVEIKSHKDVQRSDELELAFYWMLLDPYRTKTASPRGYLLLRRHGVEEEVEVEIPPHRFEQVKQLLQEIRNGRRVGVRPRICRCTVCSGPMHEEIRRTTLANKDVSLIWGIGRVYALHLEAIGIKTPDDLRAGNPVTIVEALRQRQCSVSKAQVERWHYHAMSYFSSYPVVFGDLPSLDGSFFALDLEYSPESLI